MIIDNNLKNKVTEDWKKAFPQLALFAKDKFYKVLGPLVIGIELIKLPRMADYRPYFVIYALFGNSMGKDIRACLSGPILLEPYLNKKGGQYDVSFEKHTVLFKDMIESAYNQTPLSFSNNNSLNSLLLVFDKYSKQPPLIAAPKSYLQASLYEMRLKIALYVSTQEAESILKKIKGINWDINHFEACGVDFNKWLQSLQDVIKERDLFLEIIEQNKKKKNCEASLF
ncbi:hypothetical protein [Pedobacter terrae]|uniref:hypothetical protein n=1 Tax=Pedobacter terrae TaxID=405671 RepID=UPI002FF64CB2